MVLTRSNPAAHMASALGKPVYASLCKVEGRPWHWTGNIFEQAKHGEWSDVVSDVGSNIAEKYRGQ